MPLKGVPSIVPPTLLSILASMGHGDELLIADANFPASSQGREVIHMQGSSATEVLEAVLTLLPLDSFAEYQASVMKQVHAPEQDAPIVGEFASILTKSYTKDGAKSPAAIERIDRFAFYDKAKTTYAIIATGEMRLYGNIIIKKGVIDATGKVVML
ncbi:FucU, fucose operon fucU protein [Thraustotheca clavata]|uniref:L-fucose mutarotase n=1 Tax=Thraustotheca clavata TaxID=74557 RepID=A0A1W0A3F8_9STRA|nr:FucU, fucose operon fucU protein [Thraustotheca clavata]